MSDCSIYTKGSTTHESYSSTRSAGILFKEQSSSYHSMAIDRRFSQLLSVQDRSLNRPRCEAALKRANRRLWTIQPITKRLHILQGLNISHILRTQVIFNSMLTALTLLEEDTILPLLLDKIKSPRPPFKSTSRININQATAHAPHL